jgi:hypothetical protein
MAREKGADVTVRTHPEEHEIDRPALEHPGEVPGVGEGRGVGIAVLGVDPMHARRVDRNVVEPEPVCETEVGSRIVGRDRALVAPEDVDARPLDGRVGERRKEGARHGPPWHRAGESAVRFDRVACFRLEATHEAPGERRRRVDDHLRLHDSVVNTRDSHA